MLPPPVSPPLLPLCVSGARQTDSSQILCASVVHIWDPGPRAAKQTDPLWRHLLEEQKSIPVVFQTSLKSSFCLSSSSPSLLQVRAMRLSFVGELGWELHIPKNSCLPVYRAVMAAGAKHGIIDSGYRAIDSLSIEKG